MSDDSSISEYLTSQREQGGPEVAALFEKLLGLWKEKLWYQLSVELVDFIKHPPIPPNASQYYLAEFYKRFACYVGKYMRPLSFTQVAIECNRSDFTTTMTFLEEFPFNNQLDKEAELYVQIERAHVYLVSDDKKVNGKEQCLKLLKKSQLTLQKNPSFDDLVHSNYYRVLLQYDKMMKNHTSYYNNAFRYMAYTKKDVQISEEEKIILAKDLAIAGLSSGEIFCLDELLSSSLWQSVKTNEQIAVYDEILEAVNIGNITQFKDICLKKTLPQVLADPNATSVLEKKICVTALMDLVFNLPMDTRTISFYEVSKRCEIPEAQVEPMVMHALSKDLVGGMIDQVERTIHFTHVMPRNLGLQRVKNMTTKMDNWLEKIQNMEALVTEKSMEQLVAA